MEVIINGIKYAPEINIVSGEYCRKCGEAKYDTIDSRIKEGIRFRRKKCKNCGHMWKTIEYSMGE